MTHSQIKKKSNSNFNQILFLSIGLHQVGCLHTSIKKDQARHSSSFFFGCTTLTMVAYVPCRWDQAIVVLQYATTNQSNMIGGDTRPSNESEDSPIFIFFHSLLIIWPPGGVPCTPPGGTKAHKFFLLCSFLLQISGFRTSLDM